MKKNNKGTRLYYDSIISSMYYERFIPNSNGSVPFFTMYYIDKGFIDVKMDGTIYNLKENDIFLYCPDEHRQIISDKEDKKGVFMIQFYPELLKLGREDNALYKDLLFYTKKPCRRFSVTEDDIEIKETLREINNERIERSADYEMVMRASVTKIISWILEKQYEMLGPIKESEADLLPDNIKQIIEYIDEHYMEKLYLKDIAEKFFVSYSYLSRMLKKATGKSFNEYILHKKILKSTVLLITTDFSVAEISQMLGYCSQGYFTERFIEIMKKTPTEFRKYFKNKIPIIESHRYEYYEY